MDVFLLSYSFCCERIAERGMLPQIHSMNTLHKEVRSCWIYSIVILVSICFCFPVATSTAEPQEKCIERTEREFQNCLKKAKTDKDRDACERQFAIDYDQCNVIWEEKLEE
jgi:hypothetical protein